MAETAIEWATHSWNPVTGCSKVSPGCAHCYAEREAMGRLKGSKGYPGLPWTPENAETNIVLHPDRLEQPLHWRKPRMVFVNSMSDLFHELVPSEFINRIWMTMRNAPQHTYQILTKRPERLLWWTEGAARVKGWPVEEIWPPWVWLGTSIENRQFVGRAEVLRQVPAAVRFISAEPLLGPLTGEAAHGASGEPRVDVGAGTGLAAATAAGPGRDDHGQAWTRAPLDLAGIDWLIVGGESGPSHRRMDVAWARDLRDEAQRLGVAFFFKQHGGRYAKAGGRLLDGREWNGMPHTPALQSVA